MQTTNEDRTSWIDRPVFKNFTLSSETIIFILIIILAFVTRFYDLDARVISHDENSHVYYSWRLFRGEGFAHDPLMHGPFQFISIALSYFMFGDNDFTARIPAALLSVATVAFMWFYRRYLGRAGAIVAAILMLISPFMLYYGRYVRNEAYVAFFGVVTLWAILRYLDTAKPLYLYILTVATVLHFTAKETAFIYTAQALLFLGFYLIYRISRNPWKVPGHRSLFIIALICGLLLLIGAGGSYLMSRDAASLSATETAAPAVPGEEINPLPMSGFPTMSLVLLLFSGLALLISLIFLLRGYTLDSLRSERSFDILIILGTLVLPQLAAFPVRLVGWTIPINASQVIALTFTDIWHIAVFLIPIFILSILIGLWCFTGLVGSLGYWIEQQGVNRGSQPWYYYWLVQIPIYEYLPALGTFLALIVALFSKRTKQAETTINTTDQPTEEITSEISEQKPEENAPFIALAGFWAVSSLIAYSIAGEKMPWLTVHIVLPLILCASWFIGRLIDSIDWTLFRAKRGWLVVLVIPIFLTSAAVAISSLLGTNPPFQGKDLEQLQATSTFFISFLFAMASGIGLYYLLKTWPYEQTIRIVTLFVFAAFGFLTARTAFQATYLNYDNANELLVYAHSAGGVKVALDQIEEISIRTTDGLAVAVAYDNETSYPYWWYLRNYPNSRYFGADPTRSLRDAPLILVGDANFGKIEKVVGQAYNQFDYIRLWWPNQDYYGLTWERVLGAFTDPRMRAALFQIWLNRDYSLYGEVKERDMSLPNWSPAARMRLYIRKDIVSQLWNYGAAPSTDEIIVADPYESNEVKLVADRIFGDAGTEPGQFQGPRGIAYAPDGTLYVADSDNHRIQHLNPDGTVLEVWGSFQDVAAGTPEDGTFNQPWGIEVGPDGSVYVADTWNHRIQKFTSDGEFLQTWGYFGTAESPQAFWGPRDVAVDDNGNVFVTDTGNKRVVVFDENGSFITEFGEPGLDPGQFDEPVGIAVDSKGLVYVVDAWNQRIQVFTKADDGSYLPEKSWEVVGWYGQSLDNKPYIDIDSSGNVFVTDPEGYRVLQFTGEGEFVKFWGDYGTGSDTFGMPIGIVVDDEGNVWVTDTANNRIMSFPLVLP
jgi:uncharacterized protein (TIGR03663 family)